MDKTISELETRINELMPQLEAMMNSSFKIKVEKIGEGVVKFTHADGPLALEDSDIEALTFYINSMIILDGKEEGEATEPGADGESAEGDQSNPGG